MLSDYAGFLVKKNNCDVFHSLTNQMRVSSPQNGRRKYYFRTTLFSNICQRATIRTSLSMNRSSSPMDLVPDTWNYGLRMRRECRECVFCHRGLAIPTCITARVWRTYRDACWKRSRRMHNPQFYVSGKRPMNRTGSPWGRVRMERVERDSVGAYTTKYAHGLSLVVFCNGQMSVVYLYSPWLLHRHWGNHVIAPVPVKQTWKIWVHVLYIFTKYYQTKTYI